MTSENNLIEIWKDIQGYNGLYKGSNFGQIKKTKPQTVKKYGRGRSYTSNEKNKLLKKTLNNGYEVVTLSMNGNKKNCKVHRIIAETFIENYDGKKCVNHINGVKTDNRVENLEWCTHKENVMHATIRGLHGRSKIILNTESGIFHNSLAEASHVYSINPNTLFNYISGKTINKTILIAA